MSPKGFDEVLNNMISENVIEFVDGAKSSLIRTLSTLVVQSETAIIPERTFKQPQTPKRPLKLVVNASLKAQCLVKKKNFLKETEIFRNFSKSVGKRFRKLDNVLADIS